MLQSKHLSMAALCAVAFIAALSPRLCHATLGEPEVSVQADVSQLRASIKSSEDRTVYRVHEIQLPSGTVLREFVAANGNVFAVAWSGPFMPNLRQAMGKYFDSYVAAPRTGISDRKHVQVALPDLVVQASGHTRSFAGRAYLPSAIPAGFNLGDLH
ncbi:MAG TPA: DUF2844 domain-containing protein [Steroidobacteraceae bacterium]